MIFSLHLHLIQLFQQLDKDTPALAKTACDLLLDLMNKEDNTELQKRYVLPVEIIRRESTA